jgi:hypothetical protein
MSDAAPLSPAEAGVLLSPNLAKGHAAIKAVLLLLLTKGVLRIEQTDEPGMFRTKTIAHLRIAAEPNNPPPEIAALIDIVRAAQAEGGKIKDVVARAYKAFGTGCPMYVTKFIYPALIARGLLTEKKVLFIRTFHLTPAGEVLQTRLKSDLLKANNIPKLLKSDPAQAAAVTAEIGSTILLSDKLPKHFKPLADARKAKGGDAGFVPVDSGGLQHGGFDVSSFDLGGFDFVSFDAGSFDAGIASFDAGFSDAGGGDSGGGHH